MRGAASEINKLDRARTGGDPMSFEETQAAMGRYARDFEKISKEPGGRQQDIEDAMAIDNILADTSEPGIEGIDQALEYIEGMLQSKSNVANSILQSQGPLGEQASEFLKDWQEKRAIRDALYQEKQKRVEQREQSQHDTEGLTKRRGAATTNLQRLYAQAGISEDTPSRQGFLARTEAMSQEELHFLDSALNQAAREAMRGGDPKLLEGLLEDLSSKSFKPEDVIKRREEEDQKKLGQLYAELGIEKVVPSESTKDIESPEERYRKYKNYEAHKDAVELVARSLQGVKNNFERSNNIVGALTLFETDLSNMTQQANPEDIEKLRGQPVDLDKERLQFGINEERLDDYRRIREAQNALGQGKSVQEVLDGLEKKLSETYGVEQIDFGGAQTIKDLNELKINADLFSETTDDPALVGRIKEIRDIGYHIPDVPQYNINNEVVGKFNRDIKARPKVTVYKTK